MNDCGGTQSLSSQQTPDRRPNKNKKENTQTKMAAAQKATAVFLLYFIKRFLITQLMPSNHSGKSE